MLKKKSLMTLATLLALCITITLMVTFTNYNNIARTEKVSVTFYDILARINDDNKFNFSASIRVDGFYGNIRITSLSFSINDTILSITNSSMIVSTKYNATYLVFKGISLDQKLISAVKNFAYLNIKIAVRGVNGNSVSFFGNYERTIKFLPSYSKTYYFTIFDMFGING